MITKTPLNQPCRHGSRRRQGKRFPNRCGRFIDPPITTVRGVGVRPSIAVSFFALLFCVSSSTFIHADVDFAKDIRPILADKCYACHGPDEATRQADLRFDLRDNALAKLPSGSLAIVPGAPEKSQMIHRIFSSNPDERMPPTDSRWQLTDRELQLLQEWVATGARYDLHWSFKPVQPPKIPKASFPKWQFNDVDAFVGKRLRDAGLIPSKQANRTALIRRLSFDLKGLPPSIEEVDAFLNDVSPDAYEKLVRRLLDSDHFGEKMAIDWLDLARYGDTNGYHADSHRDVWLYRDWVIDAFNSNMGFDRFVREQIAGDLIPNATDQQHIASGFNRNTPFNEEGGADPDEFSVVYAVDRANTTGQALLGLTFGCAQCHNHKYDPISQKEYYEFYAFFNSVEGEPGGGGENGHHGKPVPPTMVATSPLRVKQLSRLASEVKERSDRLTEKTLKLLRKEGGLKDDILTWTTREKSAVKKRELTIRDGLVLHLDSADVDANGKADVLQYDDTQRVISQWRDRSEHSRSAIATGHPLWVRDGFLGRHPAVQFDGKMDFVRTKSGGELLKEGYTIASAVSFGDQTTHQMLVMWGDESQGKRRALWRTAGTNPKLSFNGYGADVVGNQMLPNGKGAVAFVSQQSRSKWVELELNGNPGGKGTPALSDYANQAITIAANNAGAEKSLAAVGEVLIYSRALNSQERGAVGSYLAGKYSVDTTYQALPMDVAEIIEKKTVDWSPANWRTLVRHYVVGINPKTQPDLRREFAKIAYLKKQIRQLQAETTTMVMREMKKRKPAFILARGDFQQPGKQVKPNVPVIFGRLPDDQHQTRLDLANWLTTPDHPLVSRVRVNHLWKMLMGTGLVRTAGDFGTQGELPSHPELLDWLANRFVKSGWDTNSLIYDIVTSATYRQQSRFHKDSVQVDPRNRLLSRAPRFRLTAEEIRDMALASSGQLNPVIGGPSVRPFQPLNYFSANSGQRWQADTGETARRRAIYTYLQRTAPFPAHLIFDAPSRQICTATRPRTNTPLQALVMMNDPLFVGAAGALAQKTLQCGAASESDKARFLFRSVLSRSPAAFEIDLLLATFEQQQKIYEADPKLAADLIQFAGLTDPQHPQPNLAAWTNVASIVLNLDEAITRE